MCLQPLLQLTTDNFSNKNILGQGGFGPVYLGLLPVHPAAKEVAVKVLKKSGAHARRSSTRSWSCSSRLEPKHLVSVPPVVPTGVPEHCAPNCTRCRTNRVPAGAVKVLKKWGHAGGVPHGAGAAVTTRAQAPGKPSLYHIMCTPRLYQQRCACCVPGQFDTELELLSRLEHRAPG